VQEMGVAITDYRQAGRLKDDDGNVPDVAEIRRSTVQRTTQAGFALDSWQRKAFCQMAALKQCDKLACVKSLHECWKREKKVDVKESGLTVSANKAWLFHKWLSSPWAGSSDVNPNGQQPSKVCTFRACPNFHELWGKKRDSLQVVEGCDWSTVKKF